MAKKKFPKKLEERIKSLANDLLDVHSEIKDFIADLQAAYDEKSDQWQESASGEILMEKIENFQGFADDIEAIADSMESFDPEEFE